VIGWLKKKLPDTPCKQWLLLRFDKEKERKRKEAYLAKHLKCPNCGRICSTVGREMMESIKKGPV